MAERVLVRKGIFVEGPEGEALSANKCKSCGHIFFPKTLTCLSCYKEEMEEVALSRRGTLYSYTICHMPSSHFQPPYAVGYIDLPEGVRVFAPLEMAEDNTFRTGMEMELSIEVLWQEGEKEVLGFRFKSV